MSEAIVQKIGRPECHSQPVSGHTTAGDGDTSTAAAGLDRMQPANSMHTVVDKTEANLLNLMIVDDERAIRDGCREVAQSIGFGTFLADNAEQAFRNLDSHSMDVVLLDLRLPGLGGMEVLKEIKRRRPETVVIVMTGFASVQSAVQAMKSGAYDYVTKPFNLEELRLILDRARGHLQLTSENRVLREQVKSREGFGSLIGRSPEMARRCRTWPSADRYP